MTQASKRKLVRNSCDAEFFSPLLAFLSNDYLSTLKQLGKVRYYIIINKHILAYKHTHTQSEDSASACTNWLWTTWVLRWVPLACRSVSNILAVWWWLCLPKRDELRLNGWWSASLRSLPHWDVARCFLSLQGCCCRSERLCGWAPAVVRLLQSKGKHESVFTKLSLICR